MSGVEQLRSVPKRQRSDVEDCDQASATECYSFLHRASTVTEKCSQHYRCQHTNQLGLITDKCVSKTSTIKRKTCQQSLAHFTDMILLCPLLYVSHLPNQIFGYHGNKVGVA